MLADLDAADCRINTRTAHLVTDQENTEQRPLAERPYRVGGFFRKTAALCKI
jgi:hypothetical protein